MRHALIAADSSTIRNARKIAAENGCTKSLTDRITAMLEGKVLLDRHRRDF
jgi:hypothetical protein